MHHPLNARRCVQWDFDPVEHWFVNSCELLESLTASGCHWQHREHVYEIMKPSPGKSASQFLCSKVRISSSGQPLMWPEVFLGWEWLWHGQASDQCSEHQQGNRSQAGKSSPTDLTAADFASQLLLLPMRTT